MSVAVAHREDEVDELEMAEGCGAWEEEMESLEVFREGGGRLGKMGPSSSTAAAPRGCGLHDWGSS